MLSLPFLAARTYPGVLMVITAPDGIKPGVPALMVEMDLRESLGLAMLLSGQDKMKLAARVYS